LHPDLRYADDHKMELHIWIPKLTMAFEYHNQHNSDDKIHLERLKLKKESCKAAGITLIEIPYWWNFQKDNLVSIIREERPDVVTPAIKQASKSTSKPQTLSKPRKPCILNS
jgi:hypothetical protein